MLIITFAVLANRSVPEGTWALALTGPIRLSNHQVDVVYNLLELP